jgi:hypothetical protein
MGATVGLINEMMDCNMSSQNAFFVNFLGYEIKTFWPLNTCSQLAAFTAIISETLESGS